MNPVGVAVGISVRFIGNVQGGNARSVRDASAVSVDEAGFRTPSIHLGPADARVMVRVFNDYDCPFCKAHHSTLQSLVQQDSSISIALAYYHFPNINLHPASRRKAVFLECVASSDWKQDDRNLTMVHDLLFEADWSQVSALADSGSTTVRAVVGTSVDIIDTCVKAAEADDQKYAAAVDRDMEYAVSIGARGTPTSVINGRLVPGALPPGVLLRYVRESSYPSDGH